MQIVIDISERAYQYAQDGYGVHELVNNIRKGIVLPKGHGRLIDAEQLKDNIVKLTFYESFSEIQRRCVENGCMVGWIDGINDSIEEVMNASTVIPADKGE